MSVIQLFVGEEDIPGVCDGEEMFGPTHKCALVPSGLLDVYGGGNLCSHGCAAESSVGGGILRSADLRRDGKERGATTLMYCSRYFSYIVLWSFLMVFNSWIHTVHKSMSLSRSKTLLQFIIVIHFFLHFLKWGYMYCAVV